MRGRQTEKACKAKCLNTGIHDFERSAKDFGSHIDTERSLEGRSALDGSRRRRRQGRGQCTLGCPLRRLLENALDYVVGCRRNGSGMFRAHGVPFAADFIAVERQQGFFP